MTEPDPIEEQLRLDHNLIWVDGTPIRDAPIVKLLEALYAEDPATITRKSPETEALITGLPIFTVAHETALLREPFQSQGKPSVYSRACVMGAECTGKHPGLPGHLESAGGVILSETLTPDELAAFHVDGSLPSARRSCILCNRFNYTAGYLFARKKKSFPEKCFINQYVNSFGTIGEYALECAIPMDGDGGDWLGIVGQVCMLRLNLLFLEQNDDRKWVVNQSRMIQSDFRQGGASRTMLGHFDPALILRRYYANVRDFKNTNILFGDSEVLKLNNTKVVAESGPYLELVADTSRPMFNRLIVFRVNALNELLDDTGLFYGDAHRYALQILIDSHVPLHLLYLNEHKINAFTPVLPPCGETLPDYTSTVIDAALGSTKNKNSILRTLFHRSLPETAQLKSFQQAVGKALSDKRSCQFLYDLTMTVCLGNYLGARDPPPYAIRMSIIRDLNLTTFKTNVEKNAESISLIFYCVRLYVDMIARACLPLKYFLCSMVDWDKQLLRINESLRVFRLEMPEDDVVEYIFSTEALSALARSWKRLPKKRLVARERGDRSDALRAIAHRAANRRTASASHKRPLGLVYDVDHFNESLSLKKARFSGPSEELDSILVKINESLYEPRLFAIQLDDIDTDQFTKIHDAAAAYDIIKTTKVIALPREITAMQIKAVMKRFGIQKVENEYLARVGQVLYCFNCDTFKNIVVTAEDLEKKKNTKSSGYTKLSFDIESGQSSCCADKHCPKYALQNYDVLNRRGSGMLVMRGKAPVLVSPCCGFLCTLNSLAISGGHWTCPNCAISQAAHLAEVEPDTKSCHFCKKLLRGKHAGNQIRLKDDAGEEHLYGFCKSHFRAWARCRNGVLTMEFYVDNLKNRTGAGLALPN